MNDIWSNLGGGIPPAADAGWLYRKGGEVRGPVPLQNIVNKLVAGEIDLKTPVAKEGGDFHPVAQVAAFAGHMPEIKKAIRKRNAKKRLRLFVILLIPVGALAGAGGYYFKNEQERLQVARDAEAKRLSEAEQARLAEVEAALKSGAPKLVALVSFDEKAMKIGGTTSSKKPKTPGSTTTPGGKPEPEEMVSSCQRQQGDIFKTLGAHLAKINVCVQDQKSRDANLPPTLTIEFVVLPSGKTTEFSIAHRAYRSGPMNNCMIKAFNTVNFGGASGSNCPVSIPLKIGG